MIKVVLSGEHMLVICLVVVMDILCMNMVSRNHMVSGLAQAILLVNKVFLNIILLLGCVRRPVDRCFMVVEWFNITLVIPMMIQCWVGLVIDLVVVRQLPWSLSSLEVATFSHILIRLVMGCEDFWLKFAKRRFRMLLRSCDYSVLLVTLLVVAVHDLLVFVDVPFTWFHLDDKVSILCEHI